MPRRRPGPVQSLRWSLAVCHFRLTPSGPTKRSSPPSFAQSPPARPTRSPTSGGGDTRWRQVAAAGDRGIRVAFGRDHRLVSCWVMPRDSLRLQAEEAFADPAWRTVLNHAVTLRAADNAPDPCRGLQGYITTYQSIAAAPDLHLAVFRRHRMLLVVDKVHHLPALSDMAPDPLADPRGRGGKALLPGARPLSRKAGPLPVSPAYARPSAVATAGDLPTAPTPRPGTRPTRFEGRTMIRHGKAIVIAEDNVDTDVLYPGKYLNVLDPQKAREHLFESLDPSLCDLLKHGRQCCS